MAEKIAKVFFHFSRKMSREIPAVLFNQHFAHSKQISICRAQNTEYIARIHQNWMYVEI